MAKGMPEIETNRAPGVLDESLKREEIESESRTQKVSHCPSDVNNISCFTLSGAAL